VNLFGYDNPDGTNPPRTLRAISIGTQGLDPSDSTDPLNCDVTDPLVSSWYRASSTRDPRPAARSVSSCSPGDDFVPAGVAGVGYVSPGDL